MTLYRFVAEEFVVLPFDNYLPGQEPAVFNSLDIVMDLPGHTTAQYIPYFPEAGDQGEAEIQAVVNGGIPFETSDSYYIRYDLALTDSGPEGFFTLLDYQGTSVLRGSGSGDHWTVLLGIDVPIGGCQDSFGDDSQTVSPPGGPTCYATGHWERIMTGPGGEQVPEPTVGLLAFVLLGGLIAKKISRARRLVR